MPGFLERYLGRVGLSARPAADEDGLRRLLLAQVMAIPFENLDPFLHRPVDLGPEAVAEKLIERRRGGYCFELNGLFQRALVELGFAIRPMTGRVHFGRPGPGPRTHHLLRVGIGGRDWLADAAFGGPGLRQPIPLEAGYEEVQVRDTFRLDRHPDLGWMLRRRSGEAWIDLYSFPGDTALPIDFEAGNHFTSTWPQSPFRRMLVCYRPLQDGRVAITDRTVTIESGGRSAVTVLTDAGTALMALRDHLGLDLDAPIQEAIRRRWA